MITYKNYGPDFTKRDHVSEFLVEAEKTDMHPLVLGFLSRDKLEIFGHGNYSGRPSDTSSDWYAVSGMIYEKKNIEDIKEVAGTNFAEFLHYVHSMPTIDIEKDI